MAHKKGVGSSRNGRDSNPQYRGVKKFGGEKVIAGNIIVRQCGTKWHPGRNVGLGTVFTIYALIDGVVKFEHKNRTRFKVAFHALDEASASAGAFLFVGSAVALCSLCLSFFLCASSFPETPGCVFA